MKNLQREIHTPFLPIIRTFGILKIEKEKGLICLVSICPLTCSNKAWTQLVAILSRCSFLQSVCNSHRHNSVATIRNSSRSTRRLSCSRSDFINIKNSSIFFLQFVWLQKKTFGRMIYLFPIFCIWDKRIIIKDCILWAHLCRYLKDSKSLMDMSISFF